MIDFCADYVEVIISSTSCTIEMPHPKGKHQQKNQEKESENIYNQVKEKKRVRHININ